MSDQGKSTSDFGEEVLEAYFRSNPPGSFREAETAAFHKLADRFRRLKDPHLKEFMRGRMSDEYLTGAMRLSYVVEHVWSRDLKDAKEKLAQAYPMKLCSELENIFAHRVDSSAYTKQYYQTRRHPVRGVGYNNSRGIPSDLSPLRFDNAHYKLGSHTLFIGCAINEVLSHIEARYGINFAELEKAKLRKSDSPHD